MSKVNYVYFAKFYKVTNYGAIWDDERIFEDLTSFLEWMEINDVVFLDKDQIDRVKHGDEGAFRSKKNVKDKCIIGMLEIKKFY